MAARKGKKAVKRPKTRKTVKTHKDRKAARAMKRPRAMKMPKKAKTAARPKAARAKLHSKARAKHARIKVRVKQARAKSSPKGRRRPARAVKIKSKELPRKPRKERDAFEERIASKLPKVEVGPDPKDVEKITTILADSRVRQMLIELGGENALAIIRNFYGNHSDEEMAKKLKLKISDVRATLNKLHNEGLVNYIREKDSDTGWYSYSWSLNLMRMERWAGAQSLKIGDLVDSQYYFCPACGESSITNFDSAAEDDFRCERCNRLLDFIDEKKLGELITGKK